MGLLDRIANLFRANVNELVTRGEDPAKLLDLMIRDMEENLREGKMALVAAITEENRCKTFNENNAKEAENWDNKAKLAAKEGADELAREALKRRNTHRANADAHKAQWEAQKATVQNVRENLLKLESKVAEARAKKEILVARQRGAEARKKINEQMAGIGKAETAFDTFNRMENKIETLEAQANAAEQVQQDDLEQKFAKLGSDKDVEEELAALKAGHADGKRE